ncbi:PTS sugar transporter subunit IIA [Streptococcus dentiloxodontae]
MVAQLIKKDLIQLHQFADNQEELLSKLSEDLFAKAYVRETFQKALLLREEEFPTGLQLENTAVAIPHTYSEHVVEPFIYINKLEQPITFIQMGTDDQKVEVRFVLVLGITDPKNQTGLLVELMELFGNKNFIQKLLLSNSQEEIIALFTKR